MSRDLFRITVDENNYSNLLGTPLNPEQKDLLPEGIASRDEVRLWAINTDSPAANEYEGYMEHNDGLLFYKVERGRAPDEKMYVGVGVIGEKFQADSETATQLFRTPTAQLMFTVEDFTPISKTIDDVRSLLGYKQHPQRTQRVKENRYSSVESVLSQLRS